MSMPTDPLPYDLTRERLHLEPSSLEVIALGTPTVQAYLKELHDDYDPEEYAILLWSVAVLCRSEECDNWVAEGKPLADFVLAALDTAMIWLRG